MRRRRFLSMVFGGLMVAQPYAAAEAETDYPSKPITIVVPFNVGGPADTLARLLAEQIRLSWGQPVIVENRGGANSVPGVRVVERAKADGYTLLIVNNGPMTMNPSLFKSADYDPVTDFTPITHIAWTPLVFVTNPDLPVNSISELVAYLRENPGKLNYGAGGATTQLAAELFKKMTATDMQGIVYRGSSQAITDVMRGEVSMMVDAIASSLPYIEAGRLRALAVAGKERSNLLPDLPTVAEAGVAGYDASAWLGLLGPANLPDDIRSKLQQEIAKIIALPEVRERMIAIGIDPVGSSPEKFTTMLTDDLTKWADVIKDLGIEQQ